FNLLFKHSTTPIANPMEIRAVRREIALLKTLINQKNEQK
ncbi:MAG: 50S ribosomal protein L29, partial [Elusimicrobiaceae bacterium]|nr:50S ribosomal protein L29 [Elusimicrobiaceae bacterium]